ncbi:MAG: nicotinate-nucleotide adenylyltransferase [Hydrotalea sp.]|nr:nicotinate-nucleotide adenylyltransferase [Hydrotalea sp.]
MEIGLYFGSFNPIHIGHLIIANHVLNHCAVDQVWLIVSPQNPLKSKQGLLNEYQRLHLAKLATEADERIRVMDVEFKLPRPSFTIDTLTYLSERYPEYTFKIIMGSDSYQNLPRWKNPELIMRDYSILVYKRPGFEVEIPKEQETKVSLLDAPYLDISATQIRTSRQEKRSIRYLVPEEVREEIERSGYYL